MGNKKAFLLSSLGVATLCCGAVVVGVSQINPTNPSFATVGDPIETVLDATELAKCVLNPYTFDGKDDSRQFVYSLPGGKYIQGAVLFGDCGHQSVGDTLADPMTMDNNGGVDEKNAADFHILFSAHGLQYVSFTFDMGNSVCPNKSSDVVYGAKFSTVCGTSLYDGLSGRPYHGDDGIAEDYLRTDFYVTGDHSEVSLYDQKYQYTGVTYSYTRPAENTGKYGQLNAVAFYVNPYWIYSHATFTLTLKSITLRYTCEA